MVNATGCAISLVIRFGSGTSNGALAINAWKSSAGPLLADGTKMANRPPANPACFMRLRSR